MLVNNERLKPQDVEKIRVFSEEFKAPISEELNKAMDMFVADPSDANSDNAKHMMLKWLIDSKAEVFDDILWEHPKQVALEMIKQFEEKKKNE